VIGTDRRIDRRRLIVGGAGVALAAAAAVAIVPFVVPSVDDALAPVVGPLRGLVALGLPALALLVLAVVRARRGREAAAPPPPARDPDPDPTPDPDASPDARAATPDGEAVGRATHSRYPGVDVDRWVDRATDLRASEGARRDARESIRVELRTTTVRTYRRIEGVDREAALAAVASGEWTDDPWAGAFLAEDGRGPQVPWGEWLGAVFTPGSAVEEQIRRTLDAVDRLEGEA